MERPLVFCATSFGYGPVSKALAIAEHVGERHGPLWFVGTGVAQELARRSGFFSRILTGSPESDTARYAIGQASAVCCVMDPDFARLARDAGTVLHVVDSLFWMWHEVPSEFLAADRYWVQDFFGVAARAQQTTPEPWVVGPILSPQPEREDRGGWVVNLGGGESPFGSLTDETGYLETALRPVIEAAQRFRPSSVVVLAGQRVSTWCNDRWSGSGCRFASVSKEEAAGLLAGAHLAVTAPGLTTTLECFQLGVPTFFLPPQNYSQWWILHYLQRSGTAPGAIHWSDLIVATDVVERMDEAIGVPLVRDYIRQAATGGAAARCIGDALERFCCTDLEEVARVQRRLLASWAERGDGAAVVAESLIKASLQ